MLRSINVVEENEKKRLLYIYTIDIFYRIISKIYHDIKLIYHITIPPISETKFVNKRLYSTISPLIPLSTALFAVSDTHSTFNPDIVSWADFIGNYTNHEKNGEPYIVSLANWNDYIVNKLTYDEYVISHQNIKQAHSYILHLYAINDEYITLCIRSGITPKFPMHDFELEREYLQDSINNGEDKINGLNKLYELKKKNASKLAISTCKKQLEISDMVRKLK